MPRPAPIGWGPSPKPWTKASDPSQWQASSPWTCTQELLQHQDIGFRLAPMNTRPRPTILDLVIRPDLTNPYKGLTSSPWWHDGTHRLKIQAHLWTHVLGLSPQNQVASQPFIWKHQTCPSGQRLQTHSHGCRYQISLLVDPTRWSFQNLW